MLRYSLKVNMISLIHPLLMKYPVYSLWFIYSSISLSDMEYNEINMFFKSYINLLLFFIMMITMLLHSKLGLITIVDDYVTSKKGSKTIKFIINLIVYLLMTLTTILIFLIDNNLLFFCILEMKVYSI